jgi:ubiquinone/menaquinone biosynthesis C-methylase UbiE
MDDVYLMESDQESLRLDLKTDGQVVEAQAAWAGLGPGMRVADLGCGPGKTTHHLARLAGRSGEVVGVDISSQRIAYAAKHYKGSNLSFREGDIRKPLDALGYFDFVWVRFVLEYYRRRSFEIVAHVSKILKPGGILCLIDLDYNCLSHYGISERLERTIRAAVAILEKKGNFDPYAGRKLYTYLYDLGFEAIAVQLQAHHLIYGQFDSVDLFNWTQKGEVALKGSGYTFDEYPRGYAEFAEEYRRAFADPRRFTYTPMIVCRGCRPG